MLDDYKLVPSLPASDLDRATRFYTEKLGLSPIAANDDAVEFRSGRVRFGVYRTAHAGTAQHTLAAWEVDDIEEVVDELRARGVLFEEYDVPGLKTVNGVADLGSQLGAWFRDSEGNILALAQATHHPREGHGTMSEQATTGMGDPWGLRARDWAEIEDEGSRPLFERVLDMTNVRSGSRYLDVGCGSGLACAIAGERGAEVSGLDASAGLLAVARERIPHADLREGDMVSLPWEDNSFDAVSFINTFFFASDQERALQEAARVTAPGGRVAVTTWVSPEQSDSMAYLQAVGPLLPPMPTEIDPFISPDRLHELAKGAGLHSAEVSDIDWTWDYHKDLQTALRGLMSTGLSALAIAASGEEAVRTAITQALDPFRTRSGGYRLHNRLHCLIAVA